MDVLVRSKMNKNGALIYNCMQTYWQYENWAKQLFLLAISINAVVQFIFLNQLQSARF